MGRKAGGDHNRADVPDKVFVRCTACSLASWESTVYDPGSGGFSFAVGIPNNRSVVQQ